MSLLPDPSIPYALVSKALEPVAALLLLTGLWAAAARATSPRDHLMSLTRFVVIVAVIAQFDIFVNGAQSYVKDLVEVKLNASPDKVAEKYLALVADKKAQSDSNSSAWHNLLHPGVSLFEAFVSGVLYVFSLLAGAVLFLAYVAQKLALQSAFAVAPLFLGLLGIQSIRSIGVKYLLGVTGIVLWPLGWAIASLFTDSMLTFAAKDGLLADASTDAALAYAFRDLITAFIVGLWVVGSTITAPFVIHGAITTGTQIGPELAKSTYKIVRAALPL